MSLKSCRRQRIDATWPLPEHTPLAAASKPHCPPATPGDQNDAQPYGTDPVFMPSSTLYDPNLSGHEGNFYNASSRSEMAVTGAPFGFFSRRLSGFATGFPVLLPNRLTAQRAARMVTYLMDGNYLDT